MRQSCDVGAVQLDRPSGLRQREIVRQALVVVKEVVADQIAAIAQAQDEILVAVVRVVAHQVPDDRTAPTLHERLRDRVRMLAQTRAESAAEQNDFHELHRPSVRHLRIGQSRQAADCGARRPPADCARLACSSAPSRSNSGQRVTCTTTSAAATASSSRCASWTPARSGWSAGRAIGSNAVTTAPALRSARMIGNAGDSADRRCLA